MHYVIWLLLERHLAPQTIWMQRQNDSLSLRMPVLLLLLLLLLLLHLLSGIPSRGDKELLEQWEKPCCCC